MDFNVIHKLNNRMMFALWQMTRRSDLGGNYYSMDHISDELCNEWFGPHDGK